MQARVAMSVVLACVLALLCDRSLAQAGGVVVGVDVPVVSRMTPDQQSQLLNDLHASGVHVIRTWIANDTSYDFIKKAFALGIKVDLSVVFDYRKDAPKRAADPSLPGVYGGPPLSAVDPVQTKQRFQDQLNRLEAMGIDFVSFEVGNEQNNPSFNAEFEIRPKDSPVKSKNMSLAQLKSDPEGQKIGIGFQNYVKLLAAVKDVRDHSKLNSRTPVILGGLADEGAEVDWPTSRVSGVSIKATIDYMREYGLDKYVDAYGIHTYPWTNGPGQPGPVANRRSRLENYALSECRPSGQGKPCWITEWGIQNPSQACPVDDTTRVTLVKEVMGDLKPYVQQKRVQAVLYYVWERESWASKEEPYSIFRCGSLTPSGKLAIDDSLLR